MAIRPGNLFSSLFRWAHRQGENYTTEALVWLLNHLLLTEPEAGRSLVSWLCFGDESEANLDQDPLLITTQEITEQGKPDICIESNRLLTYVEVKAGSQLGDNQIGRYLDALAQQGRGKQCRLVLLTRGPVEFADGEARPHRHVRWHEVADRLLQEGPRLGEATSFVVNQFVGFLEEQIMTIEHVGWEYTNGVIAMRRLVEMLGKALELANIPVYRATAGWDWIGYYLGQSRDLWAGISYTDPNKLLVGYELAEADLAKFEALEGQGQEEFVLERNWNNGKPDFYLPLDEERVHFFALTKESQLTRLTTFLKKAYEMALSCMAKPGEEEA